MSNCPNCGADMVPSATSLGWCKAECDLSTPAEKSLEETQQYPWYTIYDGIPSEVGSRRIFAVIGYPDLATATAQQGFHSNIYGLRGVEDTISYGNGKWILQGKHIKAFLIEVPDA